MASGGNVELEYRVGVVKRLLGSYERVPFWESILRGMRYERCDPESRTIVLGYCTSHPCLYNARGAVHGGAVGTLLDEVCSLAMVLFGKDPKHNGAVTEIQVTYMGEVKPEIEIELLGTCTKIGRSMAFVEGLIREKESGKPLAKCMEVRYVGKPWPLPIEASHLKAESLGEREESAERLRLPSEAFSNGVLRHHRLVDAVLVRKASDTSTATVSRVLERSDIPARVRRNMELQNQWRAHRESKNPEEGEVIFDNRLSAMAIVTVRPEENLLVYELTVAPLLQNIAGSIHPGAIVTIVDWTTATAFWAFNPQGMGGVSVNIAVQFHAPIHTAAVLRVEADVKKFGNTLAFLTCRFFDKETGELAAQGTHLYFALKPKL